MLFIIIPFTSLSFFYSIYVCSLIPSCFIFSLCDCVRMNRFQLCIFRIGLHSIDLNGLFTLNTHIHTYGALYSNKICNIFHILNLLIVFVTIIIFHKTFSLLFGLRFVYVYQMLLCRTLTL